MNKTRNILMVTAIITLLFIGTKALPMQTIVQAQRDTQDEKRSIKQETTAQSANQKSGQDNTCVRGEDCEQENQGQQIAGKDNDAAGFNDQSANVQSHGAQPTQQPTEIPVTPPVTPPGAICTSPLVSAIVTFEVQTQILCVFPGLISTLPGPVGGQCSSFATVATVVIGNETFSICIISLDVLRGM
jgi:hypothetical protein